MELWTQMINIAMLGTDKGTLSNVSVHPELDEVLQQLDNPDIPDKETLFLHKAAIAGNYRQSGHQPLQKTGLVITPAPAEEKPYSSSMASGALTEILETENLPLLTYWLEKCIAKNQVATPEVLPTLLDKAIQYPDLRVPATLCAGKRGEWLSGFNPRWDFFNNDTDEDIWQNGKPDQRIKVLRSLRKSNPAKALAWLQETWAQENAAAKTDLLKGLDLNLSAADLSWLESLQNEKAQKVKDEAIRLLKLLPGSSIINKYQEVLARTISLKKEKSLLGILSKTSMHIELSSDIDESVFKSGIDRLSNKKDVSDGEFIVSQLIRSVPPAFWESHLNATPGEVIAWFGKDPKKTNIKALVSAVVNFKDQRWATAFLQHTSMYIDIVPFLPARQQDEYSIKYLPQYPLEFVQYATARTTEWSLPLTKAILNQTAKNAYQFNRYFYSQHIGLIPVSVLNQLHEVQVDKEEQVTPWLRNKDHLSNLLNLKLKTQQAFNQ